MANITDYLYLAEIVSRKFYRGKENIRDTEVYSVACESLVECAQKYDAEKGPFDRYAMRSIRNGLIQHLRQKNRQKRIVNFDPLTDSEWQNISFRDDVKESSPLHLPEQVVNLILTDQEETEQDRADKKLLVDHYLKNIQVSTISNELGTTRVTIHNRMNRIIKKLKKRIHG